MHNKLIIVGKDGSIEKHLHLLPPSAKLFNENWLQELLIANPSLLPTEEIHETWRSLIPLGREVTVASGSIDNLYLTRDGLICVVETKLWRNPEAHRTVVAQVIDYAKDLAKLTFDEFTSVVEKSILSGKKPSFWNRIPTNITELDHIEFQSKIQDSLRNGKFLLLIVGDRIFPKVALMLEVIQSAPNMGFTIGLVELHFFGTDKEEHWPLLVIPQVVGKTHEDVRAIIKILYEDKKPDIEVVAIEENSSKAKIDKIAFEKSMAKEYAEILIPKLDAWIAEGISINWGVSGFGPRVGWRGKPKSTVDIYPDTIAIFSDDMANKRGFPAEPVTEYHRSISKVPKAIRLLREGKRYLRYSDVSLDEFRVIVDATDKLIKDIRNLEKEDTRNSKTTE